MPINNITQTISTIPEAGHRGIDVQTVFVTKQEDFQDHLQGTTVTELNTLKTQMNTMAGEMNTTATQVNTNANTASTKASEASASATSASTSASNALASRNQAETFAQQAQASATSIDVNNLVHRTGDESIAGVKTFSSTIAGSISGNAGSATTLTGLTATVAELNKIDGFTGTVTDLNYAKDLRATGITATEFDYLDGVTSSIQTQLNAKAPLESPTFTGTPKIGTDNITSISTTVTDNTVARYDGTTGKLQGSSVTINDSGVISCVADAGSTAINLKGRALDNSVGIYFLTNNGTEALGSVSKSMSGGLNRTVIDSSGTNAYFEIRLNNQVKATLDTSGNFFLNSSTGALGYGDGAGGVVTQLTSKTTSVTLNKPCGRIIMNNAALTSGASVQFVLNNSLISSTDNIYCQALTTNSIYRVEVYAVYNNGCSISVKNESGATLSDALWLNFTIIKGATA